MAKELPYFKFEPSEWDNGNIQMCSRESKGLFIDLCSIYWSRVGELPYALALQKLCNGNELALQELIKHEIIGVISDQIVIQFLDEQLSERGQISEKRRESAEKRWKDANALQKQSKSNANRIEESREEEKKKEEMSIELWPTFNDFWDTYDKKQDRDKCEKKWKKIDQGAREKIMEHLKLYVLSTPDKTYRKNPSTYLNNNSWENEVIFKTDNNGKQTSNDRTKDLINGFAQRASQVLNK